LDDRAILERPLSKDVTGRRRQAMRTGSCRYCGHTPVAKNAPFCPECGGAHPHPTASRWGSFLVVLGVAIAILLVLPSLFGKMKPRPRFGAVIGDSHVVAMTERVAPRRPALRRAFCVYWQRLSPAPPDQAQSRESKPE
jgi:hypothetical protein